jgi:nucleotide-binding universal stress UspA family protein
VAACRVEHRAAPTDQSGRARDSINDGACDVPASPTPSFTSALIALNGSSTDRLLIETVVELARPSKAEVVAVHVVEVDWTLPLDADLAGSSEEAQRTLDVAEAVAESRGYQLESVLLQARDVGAALVDEATERGVDVLVVGLGYRKRFGGDFAIGRTVPYALKNAPCTVWVVREPRPEEAQ